MHNLWFFAAFLLGGLLKLLFAWGVLHLGRFLYLLWNSYGLLSFDNESDQHMAVLPMLARRTAKSSDIHIVAHYLFGRTVPAGPVLYYELRFTHWLHSNQPFSVVVRPAVLRSIFSATILAAQHWPVDAVYRLGTVQLRFASSAVRLRCSTTQFLVLHANHLLVGFQPKKGFRLTLRDMLSLQQHFFPTDAYNRTRVFQALRVAVP